MAVRATRDFDRHITDGFPARADLIEVWLAEHHCPKTG